MIASTAIDPPLLLPAESLRGITPQLWLVGTIAAVLVLPIFNRDARRWSIFITAAGLIAALVPAWRLLHCPPDPRQFAGLITLDGAALMWQVLLLLFVLGTAVIHAGIQKHGVRAVTPEFCTLLLAATVGLSLMPATTNLLMLLLATQAASLPSYLMAGFRKTSSLSAEASLKYVLFGAGSLALMVYGLSLIYALTGSLELSRIAEHLGASSHAPLAALALLAVLIGIAFKIAAAPVHLWCPDVFEGAGVDVSAFLSVASKGAALLTLMRIVSVLSVDAPSTAHVNALAWIIGGVATVTALLGNAAAYFQENLKRLLAYSSIAQAGYMLCAAALLAAHNAGHPAQNADAISALLVYLAAYVFMNLGCFASVAAVERSTGSAALSHFAGYGRRRPVLAASFTACLFSLVGLPPFAGFAAKLNLMAILASGGGWHWALVAMIAVNSVLSLYYYARVVRVMYLTPGDQREIIRSRVCTGVAVVSAATLVVMFITFGALISTTRRLGRMDAVPQPFSIKMATVSP